MMTLIGHDPGGGFAVRDSQGKYVGYPLPETETEVYQLLKAISDSSYMGTDPPVRMPVRMVSEQVGGFIGKRPLTKTCIRCGAVTTEWQGDPGSRMFVFGEKFGLVKGIGIALGFRMEVVTPKTWQKVVGMFRDKTESRTQWKRRLKDQAQKFFPGLKITLATADAFLILDFATRVQPPEEQLNGVAVLPF